MSPRKHGDRPEAVARTLGEVSPDHTGPIVNDRDTELARLADLFPRLRAATIEERFAAGETALHADVDLRKQVIRWLLPRKAIRTRPDTQELISAGMRFAYAEQQSAAARQGFASSECRGGTHTLGGGNGHG